MDQTLPNSATIGQYVVIEDDVTVGENVTIGHHSIIKSNTHISDNVVIGSHCVLGVVPTGNQHMRKSDLLQKTLKIGPNTRIGNHVVIYNGTEIAEGVFIADQASIRENITVGEGTIIGRNAMIELNTRIGAHCTIQTLAYVTGDTVIEDNVFIGPHVSMSNDKYMGTTHYAMKGPLIRKGARIGNNATLLPGITIGKNACIGAGSVVTKDVEDSATVVGVPACKIQNKLTINGGEPCDSSC